jgi:hypothetical protein
MENGRRGWVTLGSRNRSRRNRRKKAPTKESEQNDATSSNFEKSKKSANTPPPMAVSLPEKKVSGKPTLMNEENEINKISNRALEDSAKRALEPMPRQVDPVQTHRSPMAVKTRDYPKKSFWKNDKIQDSKNRKKKGTQEEQASCGSSDVSDSTSQHSEVSKNKSTTDKKKRVTPDKIMMNWIFEQKPTTSGNVEGSLIQSTFTTSNVKQELKSWPKINKVASMPNLKPNLNPDAPCFQVNPYSRSFTSFAPCASSTVPWQTMPQLQQNMMAPWRSEYPVFNSYSSLLPPQLQQANRISNDNRDSVSNLLLPYSCGTY